MHGDIVGGWRVLSELEAEQMYIRAYSRYAPGPLNEQLRRVRYRNEPPDSHCRTKASVSLLELRTPLLLDRLRVALKLIDRVRLKKNGSYISGLCKF